jgi:hypothetical protein
MSTPRSVHWHRLRPVRFALRADAPSARQFAACVLCDDGRIVFEPRDSRLAVVVVQGLLPPLRPPTALGVEARRAGVRRALNPSALLLAGCLLAIAIAMVAAAKWIGAAP